MLEIACFNVSSAITAAKAGADRIELCTDYAAGGVTPSIDALAEIRKATTKPINVMIRPRPGDFIYTTLQLYQMQLDIVTFMPVASGFVFGILDAENRVDEARNRQFVHMAAGLPCTFHRAFDAVPDQAEAVESIIRCGFTSILTSGGQADAVSGADHVARLQRDFGDRITFILGGGVRSTNIEALRRQTNVLWYHSAALTQPGETVDKDEVSNLQSLLKTNR
jgi:copper homeostasis protein